MATLAKRVDCSISVFSDAVKMFALKLKSGETEFYRVSQKSNPSSPYPQKST